MGVSDTYALMLLMKTEKQKANETTATKAFGSYSFSLASASQYCIIPCEPLISFAVFVLSE